MSGHVIFLPLSDEAHEEVAFELAMEYLWEEVQVGDESSLEDDWDVGGVEKLDWEWSGVASDTSRLQGQLNTESL